MIFLDAEVDGSVGLIAIAIFDDFFDEFDNFGDVLSDSGDVIGKLNPKISIVIILLLHVFEEFVFPSFRKLKILHSFFPRVFYDLVLDICDVHPVLDVIPEMPFHDSSYHIVADVVPGMSHVAVRIDGGSTGVPADVVSLTGKEFFLKVRVGVTSSLVRLFLSLRPVVKVWFMVRKSFCKL